MFTPGKKTSKHFLKLFLSLSPLFLVTIRSWSSVILILGAIISLYYLIDSNDEINVTENNLVIINFVIITLASPLFSIIFSSFLRNDFHWAEYDSASRFFIAITIFLFAIEERINIAKYLQYAIPGSLFITLTQQLYFPQPKLWGADRMSTYFSDPLVFGYTALTFGMISLISINLVAKDKISLIIFKLSGFIIGTYLSIMSGSRTGWLAIPLVAAIYINHQETLKWKAKVVKSVLFSLILLIIFGILIFSPRSSQRLLLASQELLSYSWNGIAPDTSIGQRITFLRIAFDMFTTHPIIGYGDTSKIVNFLPENIFAYASKESRRMAFNSGFHNEIVTNAIRYGLTGLIASAGIFIVPLIIFMNKIKSECRSQAANALIGIIFTICFFISSFSTEVFDLKYMASFYATIIALLCASAISTHDKTPVQQ